MWDERDIDMHIIMYAKGHYTKQYRYKKSELQKIFAKTYCMEEEYIDDRHILMAVYRTWLACSKYYKEQVGQFMKELFFSFCFDHREHGKCTIEHAINVMLSNLRLMSIEGLPEFPEKYDITFFDPGPSEDVYAS